MCSNRSPAMNAPRTFGPALAAGHWDNFLVYVIGPIVGDLSAAAVYEYYLSRA